MALRTEMGRVPLSRLSRRRACRAALEIGAEPRALFPGYRGGFGRAQSAELRARRRNPDPDRAAAIVRGVATAAAPGREPGAQTGRRASGDLYRLRPFGCGGPQKAGRSAV